MKVKLSFGHKAVILSLSKLDTKSKKLLLEEMLSFVCFLRMTHKKLKLNFISAAIQLLIAIWCFLIKTCYYTQRIVFFRSCCTSRNFYFQPNYPIARRRRNHCMVELGGVGVPTYRNRVVIFLYNPPIQLELFKCKLSFVLQ